MDKTMVRCVSLEEMYANSDENEKNNILKFDVIT